MTAIVAVLQDFVATRSIESIESMEPKDVSRHYQGTFHEKGP